LSNGSGKSSRRSSGNKLRLKSAKKEETFIKSGHLIGMSPHHGKKDPRLNYEMYEQDSLNHRMHLLEVIKRKDLNKKRVVSYQREGNGGFKVGYTGSLK
jgi:hypothetical protein